jgi:hypothetical protein
LLSSAGLPVWRTEGEGMDKDKDKDKDSPSVLFVSQAGDAGFAPSEELGPAKPCNGKAINAATNTK